jgi:hypothetical protein
MGNYTWPHTNHHWFTQLQAAPNNERAWVRILSLEAGELGDPLSGRLTVEELNATEPFDALSYCCGPLVLSCSITINGAPGFRITKNLWNALQRVRKTDSDRRIWVDAVCIDQEDEGEKSSQVRHMHAVYSLAEEVCIYLGECKTQRHRTGQGYYLLGEKALSDKRTYAIARWKDDSRSWADETCQKVFRDVRNQLGHWPERRGSLDYLTSVFPSHRIYHSPTDKFIAQLEDELLYDPVYNASSRQSWWKRLWTVQELLLAKHPVIYCGPCVMLWETISRIWIELDTSKERAHLGKGWKQMSSRMRMDITHLHALRGQSERNLHVLLLATIDKGFTEPKDRILALLGALPKGALSLDYGLDLRVIYTSAAMHCIATQHTFDILFSQWKRRYQIYSEPRRLYSCVPDLGQSRGTLSHTWKTPCLMRLEQGRWESAQVNTLPKIFSSEYECQRRKEGVSVLRSREIGMEVIENSASQCLIAFNGASVTAVSQIYRLGQHDLDCILTDLSTSPSRYFAESLCEGNRHWGVSATDRLGQHAYDIYALLLESCSLHLDGDPGLPVELKFEAQRQRENPWPIRRTDHNPEECMEFLAIADECIRRPWTKCLTDPLASCRRDWTGNSELGFTRKPGEVHEVLQTLLFGVRERKSWSGAFFITSDGHLGIGPESTHPGDQVVIFDGARSPFVLRALKNCSDYALLGDSFVLGLMHGEVREMDARGELESRTFVIQ